MEASENIDDMTDTGIRGALSGVNELVTFLETATSNDRSAFSKRANIIYECRVCATLFRKADGFMRHVMRCDSNRGGDVDSESDRRSLLTSPANAITTAQPTRIVPLKKPLANSTAPAAATQSSTLQQQNVAIKKTLVKPPPIITTQTSEMKSENNVKSSSSSSSSPRTQKRTQSRITSQKMVPKKFQKLDVGNTNEVVTRNSPKSTNSPGIELQDLNIIRPSRMRKTPKWLEDSAFVV